MTDEELKAFAELDATNTREHARRETAALYGEPKAFKMPVAGWPVPHAHFGCCGVPDRQKSAREMVRAKQKSEAS